MWNEPLKNHGKWISDGASVYITNLVKKTWGHFDANRANGIHNDVFLDYYLFQSMQHNILKQFLKVSEKDLMEELS